MGSCSSKTHSSPFNQFKKILILSALHFFSGDLLAGTVIFDAPCNPEKNVNSPERLNFLASNGDSRAQYQLGLSLLSIDGTPDDFKKAEIWLNKSAAQGNPIGQYQLGMLYGQGDYFFKWDYELAKKWISKSADQGYACAQNTMGDIYNYGVGVERDYKLAMTWYEKAAAQNHIDAILNIAAFYEFGDGVEKNNDTARYWYEKAASLGSREAHIALKALSKR